ncbi:hypothetical protein B481_3283 [Planococcus halocryophilus Or1]|nr:hypothetical protein B481_3283 [Planococcus halocryophilus Or1]
MSQVLERAISNGIAGWFGFDVDVCCAIFCRIMQEVHTAALNN